MARSAGLGLPLLRVALAAASLALALGTLGAHAEATTPTAAEAETRTVAAAHDLYWRGMRVGSFETRAEIGDERYHIGFKFRTRGLLRVFVDGRSHVDTRGRVGPDRSDGSDGLAPESYRAEGQWNRQASLQELLFAPSGSLSGLTIEPVEEPEEREPVPEDLQIGPDPLTALMQAFIDPRWAPKLASTEGSGPVAIPAMQTFDGRRVMRYQLSCGGWERLSHRRLDFDGEALRCEIGAEQVAGFSKKWSETSEEAQQEPTLVWMAQLQANSLWLPIKLELRSGRGSVVGYLVRAGAPSDEADLMKDYAFKEVKERG